jgi:hypothetical protein
MTSSDAMAMIDIEGIDRGLFYGSLRVAAHQLPQDKHQDMRQKRQKLTSAS